MNTQTMAPTDYCVRRYLKIEHAAGVAYYELKKTMLCYYEIDPDYPMDSDESDDDEDEMRIKLDEQLFDLMYKICLTPTPDVVIYCDGNFTKKKFEQKYMKYIENKINGIYIQKKCCRQDTGDRLTSWTDVQKITKCEIRYENGGTDNIKPKLYLSVREPMSIEATENECLCKVV